MLRPADDAGAEEVVLLIDEARRERRTALHPSRAVWPLALAETMSWGLLYYTFGVLLAPTAARLHLSEAEVSSAFSLALLAAGVISPAVGRAVDRRGAGVVMIAGSSVGAAAFGLLGLVSTRSQLYAVWACLGVAHACTSYEPAFAAIMRWFDKEAERRRALVLITSCAGFASTIFVPLTAWLVSTFGFRASTLVLASLLALLVTPLHAIVSWVRPPPRRSRVPADLAVRAQRAPVLSLAAVVAIHAFASLGAAAFLFPFLSHGSMGESRAALLTGLAGAAQVPARLLYGPLCRVVPSPSRLALLLFMQGLATFGWAALDGPARIASLVLFGAANGLTTVERASLIREWFGVQAYGARSGIIAGGSAAARAAAPIAVALIASRASYSHAFICLAGALLLAALLQLGIERARARQRDEEAGLA